MASWVALTTCEKTLTYMRSNNIHLTNHSQEDYKIRSVLKLINFFRCIKQTKKLVFSKVHIINSFFFLNMEYAQSTTNYKFYC